MYNFSQVHPGDNVFASNIAEWGTALFSLSLATNIIVTTLIGEYWFGHSPHQLTNIRLATRIWWIARQASSTLGRRHAVKYQNAVAIMCVSRALRVSAFMTHPQVLSIESGAIYSACLMTLLILYCSETNAQVS